MIVDPAFGVYVDSESARWHFNQFAVLQFRYDLFNRTIDDFVTTDRYVSRIAAFHVPFPAEPTWLERVERLLPLCQQIFVFCSELHDRTVEQLRSLDRPNVSIYACGRFAEPFVQARVEPWMDWLHTSSEFYARTNPGFLNDKLAPYEPKSLAFDVLLGNQRPHRDFVYNYVNDHIKDQVIMTYVYYAHKPIINNKQFIMETEGVELDPNRSYVHSIDSVRYYGRWITLSQVIPLTVYNQTAYTIVAETNFSNEFNFYTEKIVKPLLARRLFVVIAGQNYLQNLRAFGFRTFDGIIDETYDSIADNEQRWAAAMEQARWLTTQDQSAILIQVREIAEHNYRLIAEKNWYREFSQTLEQQVQALVNDAKISPPGIT